jgi:hypothetical protein
MCLYKHTIRFFVACTALVSMTGCFPTGTGDDPADPIINNKDQDTTTIHSDPKDLPRDTDPAANVTSSGVDSMFNLLIKRAQSLENVESKSDVYAIDFESLRRGFASAVVKSSNDVKANVGFITASVLSVNSDQRIQKVIDSLESFVNDCDDYFSNPEEPVQGSASQTNAVLSKRSALAKRTSLNSGVLSKAYIRHGIFAAGQALLMSSPKLVAAQTTKKPSFPRFLTASYIQETIETAIVSRLNEVISSTQRLRSLATINLPVSIDGENYEIDLGDILILESAARTARAAFSMMLIYNYDMYSPDGTNNMQWLDTYLDGYNTKMHSSKTLMLSGDSLYQIYYYDASSMMSPLVDVYIYNLKRPEYLALRRPFHTAVYNDLKEIPVLLKAAITSIKSETDNQDDDVFPASGIFDMTADMSDLSAEMLEDGVSPGLAAKFQTPEALMDFVSLLLTQSYTFDETIDGKHFSITVDISKLFTNPANSLKDYWPKYKIPAGNDRYVNYRVSYYGSESSGSKYIYYTDTDYDTVIINIPTSRIKSITQPQYEGGSTEIELTTPYIYTSYVDSMRSMMAIQYVDDNGKPIDYMNLITEGEITVATIQKGFPYFNDYTMRGLFPQMTTRQKWIDLISVFVE